MMIRVVDLETCGERPPADILEAGYTSVRDYADRWVVDETSSELYKNTRPIPPEMSAIHHLVEADVANRPVANEQTVVGFLAEGKPDVFVAHNAEFERAFLGTWLGNVPWICTYKVSLHAWPSAPKYSNQGLRYWKGLLVGDPASHPAHRAGPDSLVTAHLLVSLLHEGFTVEQMITWTQQPRHTPNCPFKAHKGKPWSQVPTDYMRWMLRQTDMDRDIQWHARQELSRRGVA